MLVFQCEEFKAYWREIFQSKFFGIMILILSRTLIEKIMTRIQTLDSSG